VPHGNNARPNHHQRAQQFSLTDDHFALRKSRTEVASRRPFSSSVSEVIGCL
jgi:hypothetical protein